MKTLRIGKAMKTVELDNGGKAIVTPLDGQLKSMRAVVEIIAQLEPGLHPLDRADYELFPGCDERATISWSDNGNDCLLLDPGNDQLIVMRWMDDGENIRSISFETSDLK